MEAIPDEQAAIDHFRAIRWKNGSFCPHCGSTRVYHFADNRNHKCGDCRKRFSIRVGTIFEDSKIGMRKWLMAIFLITSHKKGIASTQLAKDIGVVQKSAWFMTRRLRHAARTQSFNKPLDGAVEADETYVGGIEKNKHADRRKPGIQGGANKSAVLGIQQHDGELRVKKVDRIDGKTVQREIRENVAPESIVMTDEFRGYRGLHPDYRHRTVNHSAGEYVKWFYIHTNGIEGAWSHFKRQVVGVHHWMSEKHLQRNLDEFSWRWNCKEMKEGERVNSLLTQSARRLRYKELIA